MPSRASSRSSSRDIYFGTVTRISSLLFPWTLCRSSPPFFIPMSAKRNAGRRERAESPAPADRVAEPRRLRVLPEPFGRLRSPSAGRGGAAPLTLRRSPRCGGRGGPGAPRDRPGRRSASGNGSRGDRPAAVSSAGLGGGRLTLPAPAPAASRDRPRRRNGRCRQEAGGGAPQQAAGDTPLRRFWRGPSRGGSAGRAVSGRGRFPAACASACGVSTSVAAQPRAVAR